MKLRRRWKIQRTGRISNAPKERRCAICKKMSAKWDGVLGGVAVCGDGCVSTTGKDRRVAESK